MTFDISKIIIPTDPGIYLMRDSDGNIIYIGKAKNLKNRVKSYFNKNQNYKTQKLVENISDIEFVLTDNESEAFLLESNMIKKYRPRFNIELKDQQRYTYLRISDEKFPRLLVSRRTRDGKFLGNWAKQGEFVDNKGNLNRTGDMFEKSYTLITHEHGKTIQIVWQAFKKTPYGDHGWVEFKLDVQSPFMSDKEILVGNNKKVLQSGTFEFRNSITYKNLVVKKYLINIPLVKNSPFLKDFYLNNLFKKSLENDLEFCEIKVAGKINKLIGSYLVENT